MGKVLMVTPGRQNGSRLDHQYQRALREGLEALLKPYRIQAVMARASPYACAETGSEILTVARVPGNVEIVQLLGEEATQFEQAALRFLLGESGEKKIGGRAGKGPRKTSAERQEALGLLRRAFYAEVPRHLPKSGTAVLVCSFNVLNLILEAFSIAGRVELDQPLVAALLTVDGSGVGLERILDSPSSGTSVTP